ncbi:MAG: PAS domain-containing protein, partial [Microcystaceae cyanobacterium]
SKGTVQDVTALKQAENQLQILNQDLEKQVRQRTQEIWDFKLALDESALVAITDAQGVITYVNDRFCEMSGYSREEFLGRTHRLVKSGEHPPAFYRQLWQTITAGQVWRGEICNRKKNGDRYWVASTIVPFLDTQGEPYQYLAIRFDVTARKQAEMQLQKLSERLGLALKAGEIGCWEWNIVKNTLTWDERMFALYGHPPTTEQLPYRIWSQGVYEPDRAAKERLLHQTVAGKAEYDTEFRVLHPDGSIGFIKAYGLVIRNPEGQPQKMIGVNFDITQQKTAELELRRQAEKETLLRQISLRIRQTLDLSTTFNTACQEIREFLQVDRVAIFRFYPNSGYDDGEFVGEFVAESLKVGFSSVLAVRVHDHCFGEGYSQLYTQGRFQCVEDVLKSNLQDCYKAILSQFEIRANLVMPLLQGRELWGLLCIHTCTAPRRWQSKEIELVQQISQQLAIAIQQANLFTQLTERNEQLALSNEALARATRLKDEFLANMSHELRTPLTAILGMSESLQTKIFGDINPSQEEAIKLIEKSGEHLLSLINDILDLSKIEAGKLELKLASTSVQTICENSTIFVRQMALTQKIELQTRIAENIEQIWVDEFRIRQSLINLLSNAIKFTPGGGKIILSVQLEEQEIVFSVTDTGIGISPSDLDKLFQRFVQIDSSFNRQYAGTGLGLVLVDRIITKHGGRVSVT